jgi:hypothetical protein
MTTERQSMGGEKIFPQIGFGGTSVKMLEDGYHTAYAAVLDARRAIVEIEFNGRDYPRPGSFDGARQQRNEMLEKLQCVEDYLVEHINAICEMQIATQRTGEGR